MKDKKVYEGVDFIMKENGMIQLILRVDIPALILLERLMKP